MPALRRPCAALLLSCLLLPLLAMAEQPANAPAGDALRATAETWQADVAAMTAAGDSAARRAVLRQRLDRNGELKRHSEDQRQFSRASPNQLSLPAQLRSAATLQC